MKISFWTTSIKSNSLFDYHDAFSTIDLTQSRIMFKNDEFSSFEGESVFILAKGIDADKKLIAPIVVGNVVDYVIEHKFHESNSLLENAVIFANDEIKQVISNGSGVSLTGVHLRNNELIITHIGDNRCYLLRNGILGQITKDETVYDQILAETGIETDISWKHCTLQSICGYDSLTPQIFNTILTDKDRIILATDGIWNNRRKIVDEGNEFHNEVIMNDLFTRIFEENLEGSKNQIITDFLSERIYEGVTLIMIEVSHN